MGFRSIQAEASSIRSDRLPILPNQSVWRRRPPRAPFCPERVPCFGRLFSWMMGRLLICPLRRWSGRAQAIKFPSKKPLLAILAKAKVISKRSRVALQATSQGLTAHLFIRVKPGETVSSALENSRLPSTLADSFRLPQPAWKESGWFGTFYQPNEEVSWILHRHHGWLYWPKRTPIPYGFGVPIKNGFGQALAFIPIFTGTRMLLDLSHGGTSGQDLLQFLEQILRACDS